jgi:ribosomal protein S12 methylthiotransferase accessory factor
MPDLFARAASLLLAEDPEDSGERDVRLLLETLGHAAAAEFPAGGGEPGPETRHRACLLKATSCFARIFELIAPDAPALVSFGADTNCGNRRGYDLYRWCRPDINCRVCDPLRKCSDATGC